MQFFSKIAGVAFDGRQRVISRLYNEEELEPGTELELRREPDNPFDHNAIAVFACGKQLGYISKDVASRMAPNMDRGMRYRVYVSDVHGGDPGINYGINIRVEC